MKMIHLFCSLFTLPAEDVWSERGRKAGAVWNGKVSDIFDQDNQIDLSPSNIMLIDCCLFTF